MSPLSRTALVLIAVVLATASGARALADPNTEPPPAAAPEPSVPPVPELPSDVPVGEAVLVPVPGDKPLLVIHAAAETRRAIIYLHGMCGNVHAIESFREAAVASGTVIALLGDRACGASGRFKWGKHLEAIDARIERALALVQSVRGGLLDTQDPVLFGYSQGADRAEKLAARYPERFRKIVLGGSPHQPTLRHLGEAEAVALFAGEQEVWGHMRAGAETLAAAGKAARFFLLPKARHGEFGPSGNRVMGEVFSWLLSDVDGCAGAGSERTRCSLATK